MPGGQIVNAERIENLPGFPDGVLGADVGAALSDQATKYGLEVEISEVASLAASDPYWRVGTADGDVEAKAVIVAGGATLRKLGVPGEDRLHGAGVSYCATCDGMFFMGQEVCVVGGGDSALDEAMALTEFASKVIIFHRRAELRGQKVLQDRVLSDPKVEVRRNTVVSAIHGDRQVEGVEVMDLEGVFVYVYVGLEPNTQFLQGVLETDNGGHIDTDIWMRTSRPGLLAAGDIRQNSASQLASAAGDGATAATAAQRYIEGCKWPH